jgi:hypothetical protein
MLYYIFLYRGRETERETENEPGQTSFLKSKTEIVESSYCLKLPNKPKECKGYKVSCNFKT